MTFRKIFAGCTLFLLLGFSTGALGQSGKPAPAVIDVTSGLLTWVKHLNEGVDNYFTQEKGGELYQQLEHLKLELTDYMKARKKLSDSLFRHNVAPGKKDPNNLGLLKDRMTAIMQRMRNVTDLVGRELQEEGDKLNNEIYDALYGQQPRYLSNLEAFLDGADVAKKDLALDGSANYGRLEESVHLLASLQGKINRKLKR